MDEIRARNHIGFFLNERGLTGFGVEVGAGSGNFSKVILDSWKGDCLYLVDVWCRIPHSQDDRDGVTEEQMMERAKTAIKQVSYYPQRYALMSIGSPAVASHFRDEFFDFVYIDACQEVDAVRADLGVWWPKLKPGGLFSGHEWENQNVNFAVREFAKSMNKEVRVTEPNIERMFDSSVLSWWFVK